MIGGVILAVLFLEKNNLVLNPEFVNEIKIAIQDNKKYKYFKFYSSGAF